MALLRALPNSGNTDSADYDECSSQGEYSATYSNNSLPLLRPEPAARSGGTRPFKKSSKSAGQYDNAATSRDRRYLPAVTTSLSSSSSGRLHSESDIPMISTSSSSEVEDNYHKWLKKVADSHHNDHRDIQPSRRHSLRIELYSLWNALITPTGILLTIYFCNIVAWGGMAFLLIINVSPVMCHPNCGALDSSRDDWIETDSRTTVLLLAAMPLGLSPWRLRDLYYLLAFRLERQQDGLKRLEQIHKTWLLLPSSSDQRRNATSSIEFDVYSIPYDTTKAVLTPPRHLGVEASARSTKLWKLEFVVYLAVANIIFLSILVGVMWGFDQYDRPAWAPALFVSLALGTTTAAGLMRVVERRKLKKFESLHGFDEAEVLTDEERRAAISARRRNAWTVKCYRRRWKEEMRNWIVVRA